MPGYVTEFGPAAPGRVLWPFVATRGTTATLALERAKIPFSLHEYVHDPRADSFGLEASAALGVPPELLFKTLVATVDGSALAVGVVPVSRQLDLKALAAAVGGKRAAMAEAAVAERATGYVVGGISPVGQKRRLPIVIDASALELDAMFCCAGRRGLQMEIAPADLVKATGAKVAGIAAGLNNQSHSSERKVVTAASPVSAGSCAGESAASPWSAASPPSAEPSPATAALPATASASAPGPAASSGSAVTAAAWSGLTSSTDPAALAGSTVYGRSGRRWASANQTSPATVSAIATNMFSRRPRKYSEESILIVSSKIRYAE
jgi:Cys-tRNA(Pro)/Cys-tRNA(Cys) deacylase